MLPTDAAVLLRWGILASAFAAAFWVWQDAGRKGDPWAWAWALAAFLLFPVALAAYLVKRRWRETR